MPSSYHREAGAPCTNCGVDNLDHIPSGRPNEQSMAPFPRDPPPCNRPRSLCPTHNGTYRELIRFIEGHAIRGPEEMEYIYSKNRGPDQWADMVIESMRRNDVFRGYLEHYGILRGPGLLPGERLEGARRGYGPSRGRGRGGRSGGGRGGRMGQMMHDDRAEPRSWGAISRLPNRAPTVAGSRQSGSSTQH